MDKYKEKIRETLNFSDNHSEIRSPIKSLISLINYVTRRWEIVEEAIGKENVFRIKAIPQLPVKVYMPLPSTRGMIHNLITKGDFDLNHFPQMNDTSIVLEFDFFGKKFLFTGDSTKSQILEHKRQMMRSGIAELNSDLLKVPHHGSKDNNINESLLYLLGDSLKEKNLFLSVNGKTHPHKEVLELISNHGLNPWCTNLSSHCMPDEPLDFTKHKSVPKEFWNFIMHYPSESAPIPCQGNILVKLNPNRFQIINSTNVPCIYHN
ncbi:MAG: hypothetical protein HQM12_10490 [SAR324 cluster bacterium]|nr:hypothetical protein [SAR324 cluster bacterium]